MQVGYKEQMDTTIRAIGHLLESLMGDVKSLPGMTKSKVEAVGKGLFSCLASEELAFGISPALNDIHLLNKL